MAFLDPILNPIFLGILNASPFLGIAVISLVIALIITLVTKFTTDQKKMKALRDEQKAYQKTLRSLRDKPDQMMKVQKEAMSKNLEYMKHSFRSTLITLIPILLIFGWMGAHLTYEPIYPDETYTVSATFAEGITGEAQLVVEESSELVTEASAPIEDGVATWRVRSDEGEHTHRVVLDELSQTKSVIITQDLRTAPQVERYDHSDITSISLEYNRLKPLGQRTILGWKPGWIGLYLIFSIVFSLGVRRLFKVY